MAQRQLQKTVNLPPSGYSGSSPDAPTIIMKKLLVTLGDSWTEGSGIFDPVLIPHFHNKEITWVDLNTRSREYRADKTWPYIVAKKLNLELLNLGYAGASNSSSAKQFIIDIKINSANYEEIIVLWLLSSRYRVGFFRGPQNTYNLHPCAETDLAKEFYKHFFLDDISAFFKSRNII